MWAWCLQKPSEGRGMGSPATRFKECYELPHGYWESKQAPLEEQLSVLNCTAISPVPLFIESGFHCVAFSTLELVVQTRPSLNSVSSAGINGVCVQLCVHIPWC